MKSLSLLVFSSLLLFSLWINSGHIQTGPILCCLTVESQLTNCWEKFFNFFFKELSDICKLVRKENNIFECGHFRGNAMKSEPLILNRMIQAMLLSLNSSSHYLVQIKLVRLVTKGQYILYKRIAFFFRIRSKKKNGREKWIEKQILI